MSPPSPARPTPPRDMLAVFRARAGAILAQERGFTPACRMKLAGIARELGLSDAQLEEAIRSLTGSPPKSDNPQAEKLRQRLRKDLSGRHKTIIGPQIEARVVASAQRRYPLDEATIRQVLAEVAAELGLRHITGDQAVRLFAESVDQAVGDGTWLSREAWDRLRAAGQKWGLSFDEADQLIEQKVVANRRAFAASQLINRLVIGASAAAVLLAGASIVTFLALRHGRNRAAADNRTAASSPMTDVVKGVVAQPVWWDVDLAVAMATARREISDVQPFDAGLRSEDPTARQTAYKQLVDLAAKIDPNRPERETVVELIAGCHALDPDDACAAVLRKEILAYIPDSSRPLTSTTTIYQRAFWAAETAQRLLDRQGMPAGRAEALAVAVSDAIGVRVAAAPPSGESLAACRAALSRTLFRHLISNAGAQPAQAALLRDYLAAEAAAFLPASEIEKLNVSFLAAVLAVSEASWRSYQPLIEELAKSTDPLVVVQLLEIFQKAKDRSLQQLLGNLLVARTGAKPRSDDPKQVARAVRQALGAAGVAVAQSAEDRWEDLRAAAEPALARPAAASSGKASLDATLELARLATQAMALAQGEPGFAIFDELTRAEEADGAAEKTEGEERTGRRTFRPPPARMRPLSAPERQQLARQIAELSKFAEASPAVRANALRLLASRVPHVEDISYEQATVVARYLLAAKGDDELEGILGAVSVLRNWMQVRLAVADQLAEARLKPDQRRRLVSAILGYDVPSADSGGATLRQLLLRESASELESGSDKPGEAPGESNTSRIEPLVEIYRQRARILAVPAAEYQAAESPADVLELVARVLHRLPSASGHRGLTFEQQLELARFLGGEDPQRTVLLQRWLVDMTARRVAAQRPGQAAAAEQILAELNAADRAAPDLLAQLQLGERAALKMWMLYAVP